jgi:ATP/maltotriose-dependent transcriptional regulator MalT
MLIAPAGYGKTTLAEQWVVRDGRVGVWFTARSSSTDVAALALGIARAATKLINDCDHRLREHLRALPAPAENVQTLAEILSEDLAAWPENAWLVLDDYHEVTPEPKAEHFIEALVALSPVQFLIASRVRPRWVASKDIMYGAVLEVGRSSLTMDNTEAASVLVGRTARAASGLASLANGWPAVIGLASASSADIDENGEQVPGSLYRFFADEVFAALDAEVQQGLTTLALAPVLDEDLARALLGSSADLVCGAAVDVGLLVEREHRLDLHPLARMFLEERTAQLSLAPAEGAAETCLDTYRDRHEWDAAFDLIRRTDSIAQLELLMWQALDELLDTARLSTLRKWCEHASRSGLDAPTFALARSETALRSGRHIEAVAHAEAAASEPSLEFRALCSAGRAAHLASREQDALSLYERAERVALTESQIQDAKWGQLMCAIELESPAAESWLAELNSRIRPGDARDVVRSAAFGLSFQVKLGNLDLTDADHVGGLLNMVSDPLLVSSFQSTYSAVLGLAARYSDAHEVAAGFGETIQRYRLDFAKTYLLIARALACAGLRRWAEAESSAREALAVGYSTSDGHAQQLAIAQLSRILSQQGRQQEALDLEPPLFRAPLPSAQAELVLTRALALASLGQTERAQELAQSVRGLSRAVEPAVLACATDAVCALKTHHVDAIERVLELEQAAFTRGALDLLVTTYRSVPEVLSVLLHASARRDHLLGLVRRAGDQDLAEFLGHPTTASGDRRELLSPREREVYDLLVQGLKNREIARLLFIEESTVKVHAHHIYDKLGIRSRTALTIYAMLERADQATSATDSSGSASGSS